MCDHKSVLGNRVLLLRFGPSKSANISPRGPTMVGAGPRGVHSHRGGARETVTDPASQTLREMAYVHWTVLCR